MKKILFIMILCLCACSKKEVPLVGQTYEAQINNQQITLIFHKDGRFSGQVINEYFGQYEIKENEIKLTLQGTTMKIAPTPQLEKENKYFQDLKEIHSFTLDNKILILKSKTKEYQFYLSDSNKVNIH